MKNIDLNQPGMAEALAFSIAYVVVIIFAVVLLTGEMIHNINSKRKNKL